MCLFAVGPTSKVVTLDTNTYCSHRTALLKLLKEFRGFQPEIIVLEIAERSEGQRKLRWESKGVYKATTGFNLHRFMGLQLMKGALSYWCLLNV